MKNSNNVTIKMVAQAADVSTTTISRYLNQKYEYMSEDTRKRIETTISELGYRPSSIARSLKSKRTGLIGMVVADITSTFSSLMIKAINDVCQASDYQLIVSNSDSNIMREREYINSLVDRQVEGLVINTVNGNRAFIQEVAQTGIPMVALDRVLDQHFIDTVTTDNEKVTKEMVIHAYEAGFDRVVFFTKRMNNSSRLRRYDAFMEISKQYQDNTDNLVYLVEKEEETTGGYQRALEQCLIEHPNMKLCIFTVNGVVMTHVLKAISAKGMKIPTDIGICGYDDKDLTEIVGTGISAISTPSYDMGYEAGRLLVKRINSGNATADPQYIELPSSLKLRGSTILK